MGFVDNDLQVINQDDTLVVVIVRGIRVRLGTTLITATGGSCLTLLILGGCIFARKSDFPAQMKLSDFTVVRWVHSQNFLQLAVHRSISPAALRHLAADS